jgi:murein DD-endopeptidase MepM/ murein hydrolase activator NlpD
VAEGDSLSSIAEEYNGKVEKIREYNNVAKSDGLSVGDKVIIPNGELGREEPEDGGQSGSTPEQSAPAPTPRNDSNQDVRRGYFAHPARGAILTQRLHGYNAVDFAADHGAPITAAAPGTVVISRSGWNGGYGNYVVIKHPNGTQTLYSHNSRNIVAKGEHVERGQVIGYMGASGRVTGTHVHFEVRGTSNPYRSCGLRTRCR